MYTRSSALGRMHASLVSVCLAPIIDATHTQGSLNTVAAPTHTRARTPSPRPTPFTSSFTPFPDPPHPHDHARFSRKLLLGLAVCQSACSAGVLFGFSGKTFAKRPCCSSCVKQAHQGSDFAGFPGFLFTSPCCRTNSRRAVQ